MEGPAAGYMFQFCNAFTCMNVWCLVSNVCSTLELSHYVPCVGSEGIWPSQRPRVQEQRLLSIGMTEEVAPRGRHENGVFSGLGGLQGWAGWALHGRLFCWHFQPDTSHGFHGDTGNPVRMTSSRCEISEALYGLIWVLGSQAVVSQLLKSSTEN